MFKFQHKTAIITYSLNETGKAIAERFASLGAKMVLHYSEKENYGIDKLVSDIKAMGTGVYKVRVNFKEQTNYEVLFLPQKRKPDIIVLNPEQDESLMQLIQFAVKHIADKGRVIYIVPKTDLQNFPDFIEQMKKQASFVQQRGITLNAIVTKNDLFEIPTGSIHIADAAEFFASDLSDLISGQYIIINGLKL
ncbi:hypothetical protein [Flavobacterium sp. MDT1-60]|jgi:3-oxoacyl-[acyl-carrier protein] reductase|uniref:hypothetical protein n=1 Tax=Flavobacterium sp. MDT1-60 TaxID=1979344 RepID=UPI0017840BF3|nr:hypothetical protein [Flavobacterium sp. MDT1-60]QOG01587.1 hypothetical protein IHE43_17495 [Flavobacterium sp. MDT1-60]